MTSFVINPGSGSVTEYSPRVRADWARANMLAFVDEARTVANGGSRLGRPLVRLGHMPGAKDGRWPFVVFLGGHRISVVEMPGCARSRVRILRDDGQNPWLFPRLYVNGSSWLWYFAVEIVADSIVRGPAR